MNFARQDGFNGSSVKKNFKINKKKKNYTNVICLFRECYDMF